MKTHPVPLSPAQQPAYDGLLEGLPVAHIFALHGETGMGKTTILRELHRSVGGAFLTMQEFVDRMRGQHPLQIEETFEQMVMDALSANEIVFLDDLHLVSAVVSGCYMYPRSGFLNAPLTSLTAFAIENNKKLIFGAENGLPDPIRLRCYLWGIREFQSEDYAFLCRHYLGAALAERLDFAKVYRFAPQLNAHQLKGACVWLRRDANLDTEQFIEYLR